MPILQRQETQDDQKKPDPKPLIPLGSDWKFDPTASHFDVPHPWDQPGGGTGTNGVSLEDIHGGAATLLGGKAGPPPLNKNFQMPSCFALQKAQSGPGTPTYKSFETYDTERKVFHSPLSKDTWPQLAPAEYQAAVDACKAKDPQPLPQPVKPPAGDFPQSTLPKGQAYA